MLKIILLFTLTMLGVRIKGMKPIDKKRIEILDKEIMQGIDVELNKNISKVINNNWKLPKDMEGLDFKPYYTKKLEIDKQIFYNEPFGIAKITKKVIQGGAKISNIGLSIIGYGIQGVGTTFHGFSKLVEWIITFIQNLPLILGLILVLFLLIQLRKILQ